MPLATFVPESKIALGGIMSKTLLLADDSVTIQKVVGISFANEDIVLVTVDNGDDAIAKARGIDPFFVIGGPHRWLRPLSGSLALQRA